MSDDIVRGLGERGLLGLYVAPEFGGQGLSQTGYCRVMEEFGGHDASLSVVMGVHQSIGMKPIHLFGSDDQNADLRRLNLADPVGAVGILADYVGQRLRQVRPERIEAAHPSLSRQSGRVADQVGQLRATAEQLLRRHRDEIQFRQRQQKRLAHAAIDIMRSSPRSPAPALSWKPRARRRPQCSARSPQRSAIGPRPASLNSSSGSTITTTSRPMRIARLAYDRGGYVG